MVLGVLPRMMARQVDKVKKRTNNIGRFNYMYIYLFGLIILAGSILSFVYPGNVFIKTIYLGIVTLPTIFLFLTGAIGHITASSMIGFPSSIVAFSSMNIKVAKRQEQNIILLYSFVAVSSFIAGFIAMDNDVAKNAALNKRIGFANKFKPRPNPNILSTSL